MLTTQMKSWLQENKGVPADASDSEYQKAAFDALASQDLSAEGFAELNADPEAKAASSFEAKIDQLLKMGQANADRIESLEKGGTAAPQLSDTAPTMPDLDLTKGQDEAPEATTGIRVKHAHEAYSKTSGVATYPATTNRGMKHPLAGRPVMEAGRPVEESSDYAKALCGAYWKWSINSDLGRKTPKQLKMTDHETDLVDYAIQNEKWTGVINGGGSEEQGAIGIKSGRTLTPNEQKALIDDATSGGLELAPIAFDSAIILTPLLNGEFFPNVNQVVIDRGRRIEGGSISNVTLNSAGADMTAIDLESTTSFITAFNTTIFAVDGAIEIGLDWLSDTPIDVGSLITGQYSQVLLTWLDDQITGGDGTTEPQGIMNASGTTSVSASAGNTGPPTMGDYEGLLFGVSKAFKAGHPTNRITYGANETTYQRARSIAVGSGDARRIMGEMYESYSALGHPYGISATMTNPQVFFGVMPRYRMYRRAGLVTKATMEGKELVRNNAMMITARARFGGQVEDGSAFAVTTNAQTS